MGLHYSKLSFANWDLPPQIATFILMLQCYSHSVVVSRYTGKLRCRPAAVRYRDIETVYRYIPVFSRTYAAQVRHWKGVRHSGNSMAESEEKFQLVPNKKAKSDVWSHFWVKVDKQTQKQVENVAICRHCDQTVKYSGGTTNLSAHLNRHHPNAISKTKVKVEASSVTTPTPSPKPAEPKKMQPTLTGMLSAASKYQQLRSHQNMSLALLEILLLLKEHL